MVEVPEKTKGTVKINTFKAYKYTSDFEITLIDGDGWIHGHEITPANNIRLHANTNLKGAAQSNLDKYIYGFNSAYQSWRAS